MALCNSKVNMQVMNRLFLRFVKEIKGQLHAI